MITDDLSSIACTCICKDFYALLYLRMYVWVCASECKRIEKGQNLMPYGDIRKTNSKQKSNENNMLPMLLLFNRVSLLRNE